MIHRSLQWLSWPLHLADCAGRPHAVGLRWRCSRRKQRGTGIIEVLVALVVVSLCVLGMAGLHLTGIKHSTNGFNRSKALMLTENMATRMRINRTGVLDQFYAPFDSAADVNFCATQPVPYCQASPGEAAASCDVDELAEFDLFSVACGDWGPDGAVGGVQDMLPEGARLEVTCDDTPCVDTSTYTLSVSWLEKQTASSEDPRVPRRVRMRLRL